jgi:hypothetical protein
MRVNDQKIKAIAIETGMIYTRDGKEYGTCIRKGEKELSFEYENPQDEATIFVSYGKGKRDECYNANEVSYFKNDHPEFFSN